MTVPGYSYDLSTDIGKVRLLLRDYHEERAAFADAEIQVFLDLSGGSVERATGAAARALLADRARFARSYTRTDPSGVVDTEDETVGLDYLRELVSMYGADKPALPQARLTHFARRPQTPPDTTAY